MKQNASNNFHEEEYLECERWWVYGLLMFVGAFFGGYSYSIRGGVFANAQTANFLLMALSASSGNWKKAVYYFIPMSSYLFGIIISELVPVSIKRLKFIRWDTLFIFIEIIFVVVLGFVPESAPYQISHIMITFLAAMQFNTFRQAQGIPMATTFCTNHLRMMGILFSKGVRHKGKNCYKRILPHFMMICVFVCGVCIAGISTKYFFGKAIFITIIPLIILAVDLLYADLKKEKGELERVPHGH